MIITKNNFFQIFLNKKLVAKTTKTLYHIKKAYALNFEEFRLAKYINSIYKRNIKILRILCRTFSDFYLQFLQFVYDTENMKILRIIL